jgi:hypothetical protein
MKLSHWRGVTTQNGLKGAPVLKFLPTNLSSLAMPLAMKK